MSRSHLDTKISNPTQSGQAHGNEEYPWDAFDSQAYLEHNYGKLRDDDREILRRLAEFFGRIGQRELKHGIDVGTGTNLYPVLAMLPLCGQVSLWERAKTNCQWLRNEVDGYSSLWDPYWAQLAEQPLYRPIGDPRWSVRTRARVERGSIFDLPKSTYDIGTMFFVAESITERHDEFRRATRSFLRSLKPNAPFAAAFMRESQGYDVAGVHFPAVAITEDHVRKCLDSVGVQKANLDMILSATPLRKGVDMMLVTGRAARR